MIRSVTLTMQLKTIRKQSKSIQIMLTPITIKESVWIEKEILMRLSNVLQKLSRLNLIKLISFIIEDSPSERKGFLIERFKTMKMLLE